MSAHEIECSKGTLAFRVGDAKVTLKNCTVSLGQGINNIYAIVKTPTSKASLFDENASVTAADCCKGASLIETVLKNSETGETYANAKAKVKLCVRDNGSLAIMKVWFEADDYVCFGGGFSMNVTAEGSAYTMVGGEWTKVEGDGVEIGTYLQCHDIRECDEAHAYIFYFAPEACELPTYTKKQQDWNGAVITAGDLTVQLHETESGLALGKIIDAKTGVIYDGETPEPLFKLMIRHLDTYTEEFLTSLKGWKVTAEETLHGPVFRFEREGIAVTLSASIYAATNRIAWEIDARLYSDDLSVIWLEPPAAYADLTDDTMLNMSFGCGWSRPVKANTEYNFMSLYPGIGTCLQYFAAYRTETGRGLYLGHHDPTGALKVQMSNLHNGVLKMETLVPARGIDEPANGFRIDGSTVWQLFDGDWYDAAIIYRDFVHNNASWFRGIKAKDRKDVPQWLLETPFWMRADSDKNFPTWMEDLIAVREDVGYDVPVGVHMYMWHEIPFDTNYPHYQPAKPDFIRKIPVLQAHDIKVMPYINARLWDLHDRGDYDYQFTKLAKPYCVKDHRGEPTTEHYRARMSNGEYVMNAAMCPSTAFWQEKVREITSWILHDLNCDAVYLDQIGAAAPMPCMDKTHVHRPGGGDWWYEHYSNLLEHCCEHAGREKCFTTESNAETFVGRIGGMLSWAWDAPYQVPAFTVIYGGYQPLLGRTYRDDEKEVILRAMTAESLCFGDAIGWLRPNVYLKSAHRSFLRDMIRLRWKYTEYFHSGRCLRPPVLEGDLGLLTVENYKNDGTYVTKGVLSAMWERFSDGKRIAVVVNINDDARTVKVNPEGAESFEVTIEGNSAIVREL